MKALITGASSGIGKDMAIYLDSLGYELILVARDEEKLKKLCGSLNKAKYYAYDLCDVNNMYKLYEDTKNEKIDFLINNAGFGLFGYFDETDLDKELRMIDLNIKSVHVLTKLYLKDFIKRDSGHILNVASSAGFLVGPYLSTYYASKNYVLKLTMAISEELSRKKSKVKISALCPGPVDTNFNKVAGGSFNTKSAKSSYVSKYAIDKMFKNKLIIIPTLYMKLGIFFSKLAPTNLMLKIAYNIQNKKR